MYYVYIILCSDGSFYTGSTNNLDKRFQEHADGRGAKYTRSHKPEKIIYQKKLSSKSEALKLEAKIKKLSRKQKQLYIIKH